MKTTISTQQQQQRYVAVHASSVDQDLTETSQQRKSLLHATVIILKNDFS